MGEWEKKGFFERSRQRGGVGRKDFSSMKEEEEEEEEETAGVLLGNPSLTTFHVV